jgi:hypothetical protein
MLDLWENAPYRKAYPAILGRKWLLAAGLDNRVVYIFNRSFARFLHP